MMDDHLSSHLFYPETPLVSPPGWASNLDQADNAGMPLSKEADTIPEVLKPKRPRTAYNLFFRDQQEKMHSVAIKETGKKAVNIATLISESWKHITPSVRLHYDQLAAEDKFRYMNERIEYRTYLERLKGPQGKTKTTKKKPQGDRARPSAILQDQPNTATAIPFSTSENLYLPAAPGGPSEAPTDTTRPYTAEEMAFLADQLDQESISFLIRALK